MELEFKITGLDLRGEFVEVSLTHSRVFDGRVLESSLAVILHEDEVNVGLGDVVYLDVTGITFS